MFLYQALSQKKKYLYNEKSTSSLLIVLKMENQEKYDNLTKLVEKLKKSEDPKRKYEYILWLGKKLKEPDSKILLEENKVKGCVSEVFVKANFKGGKLFWEGYSDALITKGLLAFLIRGLNLSLIHI